VVKGCEGMWARGGVPKGEGGAEDGAEVGGLVLGEIGADRGVGGEGTGVRISCRVGMIRGGKRMCGCSSTTV
jgi:hypothetical protein